MGVAPPLIIFRLFPLFLPQLRATLTSPFAPDLQLHHRSFYTSRPLGIGIGSQAPDLQIYTRIPDKVSAQLRSNSGELRASLAQLWTIQ